MSPAIASVDKLWLVCLAFERLGPESIRDVWLLDILILISNNFDKVIIITLARGALVPIFHRDACKNALAIPM